MYFYSKNITFFQLLSIKSTSDESYTHELEEQSLIASATNKIEKMSHLHHHHYHHHHHNGISGDLLYSTATSSIYKLNGGQFGFNPVSLGLLAAAAPAASAIKRAHAKQQLTTGQKSGVGICQKGESKNGGKKGVKRLSSQSKFFIENLKKNHNDCK